MCRSQASYRVMHKVSDAGNLVIVVELCGLIQSRVRALRIPVVCCTSGGQPIGDTLRVLSIPNSTHPKSRIMDFERQRAGPRPPPLIHHSSGGILHCAKQPNRNHFGHISPPSIYKDQRDLWNGVIRVCCRQLPNVRNFDLAVGSAF